MAESSQKFIARNRAPRVQIEYDVELYGAQKKVELPFIMGVMSDLGGKSEAPLVPIDERKMVDFDMDNFDERLKSIKPRVAYHVPNTLSEDGGKIAVDITFESMEDFTPEAVANKVEPLRKLLEARKQLSNLITYMDGKSGAEGVIEKLLADPALMQSMMQSAKPDDKADNTPQGNAAE